MPVPDAVVYAVDDEQDILKFLEDLMSSVGLHVKVFDTARGFLEAVEPGSPGCLITDVRMPDMSGLELQRTMLKNGIDIPVIVMTGHAEVDTAVQAMKDGAFDFVKKPFDAQALLDCVQKAVEKSRGDFERLAQKTKMLEHLGRLTPREREVLEQIVAGEPNKRIAQTLNLSERTVEFHRSNLMEKMEARSVTDLVRMALAAGITS